MTVPTAPTLQRMPNVELMRAGTWPLSTGECTFTAADFAFAVAALDCPAVRRPVLKLGHTDPRFDGEPAVGYVDHLTVTGDGSGLNGDFAGMPSWMTPEVLASAYPDRSIEGRFDFRCTLGHTHPFVLTGVALLGTAEPAIGTLTSLQDVAALYGVAAAAETTGVPVVIATKGTTMPNPQSRAVAAGVTVEDLRRAYYEDASWSVWIEEIQLEPMQLIVIDDANGQRSRVPITLDPSMDGEEAITFGVPVPVVVRYDDVTPEQAAEVTASTGSRIRFAGRAESRPGPAPRAANSSSAAPAAGDATGKEDDMSDLIDSLRSRLGTADDADEAAVLAVLDERLAQPAEAPEVTQEAVVAHAARHGLVTVDRTQWESTMVAAEQGREARAQQLRDADEQLVAAAVGDGRIAPARREHWLTALTADREGAQQALAGLAPGLIPVTEAGYGRSPAAAATSDADLSWFGPSSK